MGGEGGILSSTSTACHELFKHFRSGNRPVFDRSIGRSMNDMSIEPAQATGYLDLSARAESCGRGRAITLDPIELTIAG
jgi:hypothetical protein